MDSININKNIAHIVYASDDKFAEIMGVSIVSLLENNKDMDDIIIYILDSGIKKENKEKIEDIFYKYKRSKPIWILAKNISEELGMNVNIDRGSVSQYARLFVSSVLPSDLERIIYLDCDTIINGSIKDLWNLNIEGKTIAAMLDAFSKKYRSNIDLNPNDIMFNSGVMLIDLNEWKSKNIESRLLEFIIKRNGKVQQGDQGVLNAVLSKDVYCFKPIFNSVSIFYDFNYSEMLNYRKPPFFYDKKDIDEAINNPVIIHFTTSFASKRPWIKGCNHRYLNRWNFYKELSPWNDSPLRENSQKKIEKIIIDIINIFPRKFSIFVLGIIQAYVRPLFIKLTTKY